MADQFMTLADRVKMKDPDDGTAKIVEALSKRDNILKEAPAREGNLDTGHRLTIRSGLPAVGFRNYNEGTDASKSETIQVDEATAEIVGISKLDKSLAELGGDERAARMAEDSAFMQSIANLFHTTFFYGNSTTDPKKFHGMTPRFNDLSAANGDNIINDASTSADSDQHSMWFITWSDDPTRGVELIYPKGKNGGLVMTDLGLDLVDDGTGKDFLAWRTHFKLEIGVCVKDWRDVSRIVNIDESATASDGVTLVDSMVKAYNALYEPGMPGQRIYADRATITLLDLQIMNKNAHFDWMEWSGRKVIGFRGIPIIPTDALIDESIVS